jgi:glyceraldehyde 3-phosphate dehydrogenase
VDTSRQTDAASLNQAFRQAAEAELRDVLGYTEEPLVSTDYLGSSYGGVVDGPLTSVAGGSLAKVFAWYDNETGFTHQLLRLARKIGTML